MAAAGGVVVVQEYHAAYGNMVEVDHGNDLITRYAHASKVFVKKGDIVKRGQRIAEVGTTGRSTGPHLHFEFRDNGVHQDPLEIARESENIPISPSLRARFDAVAQVQRTQLDAANSIQQASAE